MVKEYWKQVCKIRKMATESRKFYFDFLGRFQGEIFFAKSFECDKTWFRLLTKNEKSKDYCRADLKQRVLFFITMFVRFSS